ncbi:MAG: thioredoxin-disulfide reductase [SAR202 cluster bacterium]|nr:thioredoxin-disulfide reductase [SAR202 cluster bacterium]
MNEQIHDIIIIGSGPAGDTAALYAARANLKPLVIEGIEPGGQLMITTDVENYPGFPKGIQGPELMEEFKAQAERFGAEYIFGEVSSVDFNNRPFTITVDEETTYKSNSVIIATGATAKLLGLESESNLMGRGVSACATCDGFFFQDQEVAVVGGGDTAMEEALFLTRYATSVKIIHRRDELRASKIMQERAVSNPKIEFIWNTEVIDILANENGEVAKLKLHNLSTSDESELDINGLFIAIGHQPNTQIFDGIIDRNENGYILTNNGTKTNIEGVFACGDAQDWIYRQAVTAAGTGCMAAIDAERYLAELE